MLKIKKGDQVLIITGKDKDKKGEIIEALPLRRKVIVKGINIAKKSIKKSKENQAGGYIEVEMPLDVSNVMLFCPKCNKGTKIAIAVSDKDQKIRVCKKCQHKFE